jgi:murein DD-endopeptidase MepM/ murein hydrolase activator NlpD
MKTDYNAYYFTQGPVGEYFNEKGNSLRKAFLKAPLKFKRVSSHFSNSRMHPVLKIRRPYHGVDYEAAKKLVENKGIITADLQADLDKVDAAGIPTDIVFEQGPKYVGL